MAGTATTIAPPAVVNVPADTAIDPPLAAPAARPVPKATLVILVATIPDEPFPSYIFIPCLLNLFFVLLVFLFNNLLVTSGETSMLSPSVMEIFCMVIS